MKEFIAVSYRDRSELCFGDEIIEAVEIDPFSVFTSKTPPEFYKEVSLKSDILVT